MPKILTLNLHCYQEENQSEKFSIIARAIFEQGVDFVLLQEVSQHHESEIIANSNGVSIKKDNAALLIVQELKKLGVHFDFVWDWSHFGWEIWEEGVAILSRHPISNQNSKYVTENEDKNFWLSRKVLRADIDYKGETITLVSVHLGFWDNQIEPFENQFQNLVTFSTSQATTIVAGDFNVEAGTPGYDFMIKNSNFRDLDLECNPEGMFAPTIGGLIDGWNELSGKEKRIDYIFSGAEKLICKKVDRIFTENCYGEVSDHFGLLAEFELLD